MAKKQVILAILDGWGIGPKNETNPIYTQGTPNLDYIKNVFLIGSLQASGISVGLPWGEEGNSEVGHLTIGAGKVLYQHYPRITLSIQDGGFQKNKVFLDCFAHVKKNKSALNLAGLITEANIHASLSHWITLINLAKSQKLAKINLHLFSDGKDSEPKSFLNLLKKLEEEIGGGWKIGSLSGRYYALDRDKNWSHTQQAYEVMTGNGQKAKSAEELALAAYRKNLNDQQIQPSVIDPEASVKDSDALIFMDFREDGIRQIASAFILKDFKNFPVKQFSNLYIATMTNYLDEFRVPVAYPPEKIQNPLGKVLADNGKSQLRIAETEKYAHITYFFNDYLEQPFPNEYRIIIPSKRVANYNEKPEMQTMEITARVLQAIEERGFDFILVNYANGDMVAHTGDYQAGKLAAKTVDEAMGLLIRSVLKNDAVLIITADHGNLEVMVNPKTGEPLTAHDPSPVPIYIVGNEFVKQKTPTEVEFAEKETAGILSDVAPTILELLDIPKPTEMTGQSLLKILKQ